MKRLLIFLVFLTFITGVCSPAFSGSDGFHSRFATDNEIINRPVNFQGLTGLLLTNSAYTQPAGSVTFGLFAQGEDSKVPNNSIAQGGGTITVGLTDALEVGIRGKMIGTGLGSPEDREVGAGDAELLMKWRFSSQGETMPALAFGLGWTFPTGSSEQGFTEVEYEGIKLMVMASAENRVLDEGFAGIYLEAQAVFIDQLHRTGDSPVQEKYGVINAGILFPLSDDNRLQVLFEYNRVLKKNFTTVNEGNYTGFMPGLRYVTDNFNICMGIQRISREEPTAVTGMKGNRGIGTVNYRF